MEREACVCDHGFERSDLCAEIMKIMFIHKNKTHIITVWANIALFVDSQQQLYRIRTHLNVVLQPSRAGGRRLLVI